MAVYNLTLAQHGSVRLLMVEDTHYTYEANLKGI